MKRARKNGREEDQAHIAGSRSRDVLAYCFGAVSDRYLLRQKNRLTPASYSRLERIVSLQRTFFGEDTKLASIRKSDIEEYVRTRKERISAATMKKELNTLAHLLSLAVEWGLMPQNPAKGVARPQLTPYALPYITRDELRRVIDCCPEWLRPIVVCASFTGMNVGELLDLRWRNIDLQKREICICDKEVPLRRLKQASSMRFLPISEGVLEILREYRHHRETKLDAPVFDDAHVKPLNLSQGFRRACQRAGLPGISFHHLRHTFAKSLIDQGVDIRTLAYMLGHRDLRTTLKYYTQSDSATPIDAVNAIRIDAEPTSALSLKSRPQSPTLNSSEK